jgi:TPR repeat protein
MDMANRVRELRLMAVAGIALFFLLGLALGAHGEAAVQAALVLTHRPAFGEDEPRAQSMVALRYYHGRGVIQDHKEAVKRFRHAAERDDAVAEFYLGIMFAEGQGVPQDRTEAARWFGLAAGHASPEAQYNLGLAYATGEGVPLDNITAHMWFNLAAANFPTSDKINRGLAVHNRDMVARRMTSAEVHKAETLASRWSGVAQSQLAASNGGSVSLH